MATWQRGINSGGFLAGIGGQNSNAPKASDVSEALAYIRQNNEMERSGRNNIGLQALQGLGSVAQTYQAAKQQEADAAFQKEYAAAIQSGDRQQVRDLMTKYPGQLEKIQSGMKWADEDQRNSIGTLAAGARLASSSPEAMQSWLQNNAKELTRVGVDPNSVAQMYQQNPSGFGEFVDHLGMAALGPIDYFNVQDKMVGRQQEQQRINETIRNNDMTNARAIRGQDLSYKAQMARLNHDKYVFKQSQAALERAGQLQDMDVLSLNSQIAATGIDPLTGKAATSARMSQAKRWLDGNNNYNNALITGERGIEKIDSLLGKKELEGIGRFEGRNIDGFTSAEGLANRNAIEELKSGAFVQNVQTMRGMGSLSNAEGQKLENLIAKLDITQPEEVVRKQLSEIRSQYSVFQKVAAREAESMGYSSSGYDTYVSERKSGSDSNKSGFSSLWGD
ncbi:phage DNA ejection protein [Escherichia coli]|uniref:phage DNA ejection protein n=1 Tax=Escherichia coli TaxID=562 RepID=UPI00111B7D67|nr:phage DNA ejection protein [Escherichia coli]ELA3354159.1 phage DNA ejection protein [Escherichia coli]ELR9598592.1 phage DNA ejection protein [Escherichia coli]HBC0582584.1 phage DNA ejection protein [Escherichia coli]HCE4086221.1 phage DNA ejection protein [Escherichia coli]HCE4305836.1 phage DNA ejection protein [Escherichia coli]